MNQRVFVATFALPTLRQSADELLRGLAQLGIFDAPSAIQSVESASEEEITLFDLVDDSVDAEENSLLVTQ